MHARQINLRDLMAYIGACLTFSLFTTILVVILCILRSRYVKIKYSFGEDQTCLKSSEEYNEKSNKEFLPTEDESVNKELKFDERNKISETKKHSTINNDETITSNDKHDTNAFSEVSVVQNECNYIESATKSANCEGVSTDQRAENDNFLKLDYKKHHKTVPFDKDSQNFHRTLSRECTRYYEDRQNIGSKTLYYSTQDSPKLWFV